MTGGHQKFYEDWQGHPDGSKFLNTFPYTWDPGKDSVDEHLPFYSGITPGNRILVTESYDKMFHRLLRIRDEGRRYRSGAHWAARYWCASVTRSPPCAVPHRPTCSPGKTTFLKFMLARLISAHQVVLLCDDPETHLFYHGKVYSRSISFGFKDLPRRRVMGYCPIWALIDVGSSAWEPPIVEAMVVWPIQASSNPGQWRWWNKQYRTALLGMPRWNTKELVGGCAINLFSRQCDSSLIALHPCCSVTGSFQPPMTRRSRLC